MTGRASIQADYAAALTDSIAGRGESTLVRAYELGRLALDAGMGVLDMAVVQHEALAQVLARLGQAKSLLQHLEECQRCFLEALAPFEMTHRGVREANAALRHFNGSLEAEIKRIAHVLHDETGQLMVAINLELDGMQRVSTDGNDERLTRVRRLVQQAETQMRHLTHEIWPAVLDDLGLVPAIEFLRDGIEDRSDLRVRVEGPQAQRFPQSIEVAVYRVVQEALTNVLKHAKAANVTIEVRPENGRLVCSIQDDGLGFDTVSPPSTGSERGFGLAGMKERIKHVRGTLEIRSAPGHGTQILVSIPLVN